MINIRRKNYRQPIHKMRGDRDESLCGLLWRDNAKETIEEVTCKHCLRMIEGYKVDEVEL